MRIVIYGAGAVGATIGGRLAQHGHDVTLIARGAHAAAMRERGLVLVTPEERVVVPVRVVEHPRELAAVDLVVLAMKSQDTQPALAALPAEVAIACAQNGVANERAALRRFADVTAVNVMMPVSQIDPGVVEISSLPVAGMLDVGRYPQGVSTSAEALAAALISAKFESNVYADIMRWKYAKLLMNVGNAVEAATGRIKHTAQQELAAMARDEARAVLAAAAIAYASEAEMLARRGDRISNRPIAGAERKGGSSWQSLARGTGAIEADYLNGEIVLLGRLHGIATPVNAMLQRVANALARAKAPPGSLTIDELVAELRG